MRETHKKLESDPMFALEHLTDDVQKKDTSLPTLEKIENRQKQWKDDYMLNKIARNKVYSPHLTLPCSQSSVPHMYYVTF